MKKILTIIIPSYNVENYLEDTLNSLIICKYLKYLDIIIVNDGSKDKTVEIADFYAQKYPQSITAIHKLNGGHGSTINSGLKKAKGDYFIVIDGDDWVESKKLDEFLEFLQNVNSDIIVTGHYRNYIVDGREEKYFYKEVKGFICDLSYLLENNYLIPMTDICYKTDILRKVNLKIQENTFYVDEEFCTIPCQIVETICFFGEGFYHYRIGDINQSISTVNSLNRISHKERVLFNIYKILFSDLKQENKEYILRKLSGIANSILMLHYLYQPNKKEGRKEGKKFYNKICSDYKMILPRCKKINFIFYFMNILNFGEKHWDIYKKFKYKIRRIK